MTDEERREQMARKLPAIIVDFDGTLALKGERKPYDWSRVGEDQPNLPVVFVVRHLALFSTILIVSGRDEECRWQSEMWLHAQSISFHELFMRPKGDNRPDTEVKRELYERKIRDKYNVLCVLDDRPSVIRMWQSLDLFVFDCNNGRGEF
jgi:hypothetical protein